MLRMHRHRLGGSLKLVLALLFVSRTVTAPWVHECALGHPAAASEDAGHSGHDDASRDGAPGTTNCECGPTECSPAFAAEIPSGAVVVGSAALLIGHSEFTACPRLPTLPKLLPFATAPPSA